VFFVRWAQIDLLTYLLTYFIVIARTHDNYNALQREAGRRRASPHPLTMPVPSSKSLSLSTAVL